MERTRMPSFTVVGAERSAPPRSVELLLSETSENPGS
jgi:hypothetical protein